MIFSLQKNEHFNLKKITSDKILKKLFIQHVLAKKVYKKGGKCHLYEQIQFIKLAAIKVAQLTAFLI